MKIILHTTQEAIAGSYARHKPVKDDPASMEEFLHQIKSELEMEMGLSVDKIEIEE